MESEKEEASDHHKELLEAAETVGYTLPAVFQHSEKLL